MTRRLILLLGLPGLLSHDTASNTTTRPPGLVITTQSLILLLGLPGLLSHDTESNTTTRPPGLGRNREGGAVRIGL